MRTILNIALGMGHEIKSKILSHICVVLLVATFSIEGVAQNDSPYEISYPELQYGSAPLQDAITSLQQKIGNEKSG